MKIVINAGHTKFGNGTGARYHLNESVETRKIAYELLKLLADTKYEVIPAVYDCNDNNLKAAVECANIQDADLFVSIHLNAGGGSGVEAYTWKGENTRLSVKICENISKLGFKNRGIKDGSKLYVIRNTKMQAVLIECCFIDSADVNIYNSDEIAKAIYEAIVSVIK